MRKLIVLVGMLLIFAACSKIVKDDQKSIIDTAISAEKESSTQVNEDVNFDIDREDVFINPEESKIPSEYYGTYKVDTIAYNQEELVSHYIILDEENITFYHTATKYFQKMPYTLTKGSNYLVKVSYFTNSFDVEQKLAFLTEI